MGVVGTHSREKHTAEPVQFGRPPAVFSLFGQCFCLTYRLKSFERSVRKVQSFGLQRQIVRHIQSRAGRLDVWMPFSIYAMPSAVSPEALHAQPRKMIPAQPTHKMLTR